MESIVTTGAAKTLEAMRAATLELAKGSTLLTTQEAVEKCPFEVTSETLLTYPDFILPRFAKNPRARRKTYLWDPRDIAVLPTVLRRWERAIAEGDEAEKAFAEARRAELMARDEATMSAALKEAA